MFSGIPDSDIYEALWHAFPVGECYPGDDYDYLVELDGERHKIIHDKTIKAPKGGYGCTWMWAQRKGKPWEKVLEEIVRRFEESKTYAVGM